MADERLYQFPPKATPVPADLVYVGDSANSFNEVASTVAEIIGAYPNLVAFGGLTLNANTYPYVNASGIMTTGTITTAGISFLQVTPVNNAVLGTNGAGAASLLSTLPTAVQANITQLGTQAQNLNMGGFLITNGVTPISSSDYAIKSYVDAIATQGVAAVVCSTTANLNATYNNGSSGVGATLTDASGTFAAFSVDGQSPSVGQRVLVKNQSTQANNGIYVLTQNGNGSSLPWILTRSTDYNTVANINASGLVPVLNGTVNGGTSWYNTTTMVTIGTTAITFSQFSSRIPSTSTANLALLSTGAGANAVWSNLPPITKINTQEITATGAFSYVPTTGTQFAIFELQGGGGGSGGAGGGASAGAVGGGGGGGGYLKILVTGSANLASITGSVGVGGTAGDSGITVDGGAGGNTTLTINGGTQWIAGGGAGGARQGASSSFQRTGSTAGGTNTVGTNGTTILNIAGGNSGTAAIGGSASSQSSTGCAGGQSRMSNVTFPAPSGGSDVARAGNLYGSGAAGACNGSGSNMAGAAGGQGVVTVMEFICS